MAGVLEDRRVGVVLGRVVSPLSPSLALLSAYEHQRALYIFGGRVPELYYGYTNNMAVRRALFDSVGPFEEVDRGADVVFVHRVAAALCPGAVRYAPDAVVEHLEMTDARAWLRKMFIYGRSSRYYRVAPAARTLSGAERLDLFRRTVRDQRCVLADRARLFALLAAGVALHLLGRWSAAEPRRNMKVLVVTPYPIAPLTHGGRVRTSRLGAALARAGAEVDVLCPWQPGVPWRLFRRDGVTYHPHAFATNVLPAVLDGRVIPPLVALSWQPFRWGPAQRFRRVGPCDIVQFDFCAYAAWMERVRPSARVVYSAHNVEYDFAQARTRRSIVSNAALRRLAALESRAVRASALVVTCTAADAERMRDLYGGPTRFEVIPNGFDEALLDGDRRREPRARPGRARHRGRSGGHRLRRRARPAQSGRRALPRA
jgi:hypothetical protein